MQKTWRFVSENCTVHELFIIYYLAVHSSKKLNLSLRLCYYDKVVYIQKSILQDDIIALSLVVLVWNFDKLLLNWENSTELWCLQPGQVIFCNSIFLFFFLFQWMSLSNFFLINFLKFVASILGVVSSIVSVSGL